MFSFWKSPEEKLQKKREAHLKTETDTLHHLIATMLFEGKSLTEILFDTRIVEYLFSDEQFECVVLITDVKASILLQKKLISQFASSDEIDAKHLKTVQNKQVRYAILERNRKNIFTCAICSKEHYLPGLKINEPVIMKCDFCNFEIYINKRESGAITRKDNQWRKFESKLFDLEGQIGETEEQIEEIDEAIFLIENPDDYESETDSHLDKYLKLDKETLEEKKTILLKKKEKLDDKLDPLIDKRFDNEDKFRNRMYKWKEKYKKYDWNKFVEEARNR